jgi:hypothetical protein
MKLFLLSIFLCTSTCSLYAADSAKASISQMEDRSLSGMEHEWVSLAEAMPADKYSFAPTSGTFEGVRTFQQQVGHVATVLYTVSSGVLEQKPPVDLGSGENGPATLKTKDDYVKFLKDAFAYAHKAMHSLTNDNFTDMVPSPFGKGTMPRGSLAQMTVAHSFDHYGQSVVYARMNNVVPPASRK